LNIATMFLSVTSGNKGVHTNVDSKREKGQDLLRPREYQ
jgi:hypothetical protein